MVFIVVDFVHHDDDKTDEHQGQAYRVHYPMQHHPAHPGHFGADVRLARDAEHRFRYQETHLGVTFSRQFLVLGFFWEMETR